MITYRVLTRFKGEELWREEFWDIATLDEAKALLRATKSYYPELEYGIIKVEEVI